MHKCCRVTRVGILELKGRNIFCSLEFVVNIHILSDFLYILDLVPKSFTSLRTLSIALLTDNRFEYPEHIGFITGSLFFFFRKTEKLQSFSVS